MNVVTTYEQANYLLHKGEFLARKLSWGSGMIIRKSDVVDGFELILVPRYGRAVVFEGDEYSLKRLFKYHSFYVMNKNDIELDGKPSFLDLIVDFFRMMFNKSPL